MQRSYSVSEVARLMGVRPRDISDLFYQRQLDEKICPVVCGRRLIPQEYVPEIQQVLRAQGLIPASEGGDES